MRSKTYKYYFSKYLWGEKYKIIFLGFLMIGNMVSIMCGAKILSTVIDGIIENLIYSKVLIMLVWYFLFVFFSEITKILIAYESNKIGLKTMNLLRKELLCICLEQKAEINQNNKEGELIEIIESDVENLKNFFSTLLVVLFQSVLTIVGILCLIYFENIWLGIIETVFVMFVFYLFSAIHNIAIPKWKENREYSGRFYGTLGECIEIKEDMIANGMGLYVVKRLEKLLKEWLPINIKANIYGMVSYSTYIIIVAISYAIIFGGGAYFWIKGEITIGIIYLLYKCNQNLIAPIEKLRKQIDDLQRVNASIARIQTIQNQPLEREEGIEFKCENGIEIEIKNLRFGYVEEIPVLCDISFSIQKNQKIGIIGRSGSGKSTLVKLLVKQYTPLSGEILINKENITYISTKSLRKSIAYVTQDIQVIKGTLRDNISLFDKSIKDTTLLKIINELGIQEWYSGLEMGLDTIMNGEKLSGGQKQLIALLRVFVRGAQLIILDEAYSNIDPLTEKCIQTVIEKIMINRTCIIIAHRLSTLKQVDEVILLEEGKIVEKGSFLQLANDTRSRLYHLQKKNIREILG